MNQPTQPRNNPADAQPPSHTASTTPAAPAPTKPAQPAHVPATHTGTGTGTTSAKTAPQRTIAGATWTALIVGAGLLILLLIFIMQNQQSVDLNLFAWHFTFPAGVGFLLAAIVGALIMALVGGVRMLELRRHAKRNN
ncbi:LapA family protein [Corynebacterium uberis]|uniref:LapA family protein n=1 Tax=Corynebacterium TaxID=1716 RepID=UPI001D0B674E|nr:MULTISPECIES: lipopolysaccharide assembly protein LapA domain-containing protein [Corynebacterium]MCZ9308420.1 lipopolysaccharide assembly protein LapA domain-containing protein [Corynebacterium sp. c6VSa_13]UDL74089.1 lipopolysaccharide assembly protein LapA domain-containing protein [Corynebacterium uberis]UDL75027.1 lipopolysaccharide assembly protein LapA domain-containing protein [Corynebacterium uberis]UDL77241.1 lipopolysaccharide assembly protein LapA domain-containing protein [Coryn